MKKDKKILRISYGIDISMEDFSVSAGTFSEDMEREISSFKKFKNNQKGFEKFLLAIRKHQEIINQDNSIPVWFVMEASGVYYENLAYYLYERGFNVHVALANKIKNFTKTLENKSKTDDLDSRAITLYGLEKQLNRWNPPSAEMKKLKELNRELCAAINTRTMIKNQKHAKESAHDTNESSVKRNKELIRTLNRQIKQIGKEIEEVLKNFPELKKKVTNITKIKGVGTQTVVAIICETNGFAGIENRGQLTSYVGLDIKENQSGKKTGKASISKHGNKYVRRVLYMPALCCKKHDKKMKDLYERVCERHGWKNKKIAITAVMRKILHIIYALWKNDTEYDPNYGVM